MYCGTVIIVPVCFVVIFEGYALKYFNFLSISDCRFGIGDNNYCRNPERKYKNVWCYTTNSKKRWDWCDVPECCELTFIQCRIACFGAL